MKNIRKILKKGILFGFLICLLSFSHKPPGATAGLPAVEHTEEVWLGSLAHLGGAATEIRLLKDDYACLVVGLDLIILDVIDPSHIIQVGQLSFSDPIEDLFIFKDYAYLLVHNEVHIADLTDPLRPIYEGVLSSDYVSDMDGEEDFLFLVAGEVNIYSLSNPASPELFGVVTPPPEWGCDYVTPTHYNATHVVANLPYLYVHALEPCWNGIFNTGEIDFVADISDLANPILLPDDVRIGFVREVAETQDYVFFHTDRYSSEIQVVDRKNLDSLIVAATISSTLGIQDITVHGDYLYLAEYPVGIRILDISNPLAAFEVGIASSLTAAYDMVIPSRLAYVATGSQGLVVLDVRNPASPSWVGDYRTVGNASALTTDENYAYISSDRLDIVDISDPSNLNVIGEYVHAGTPTLDGDVLYLASGMDGLITVDIRNPAAPIELGLLNTAGEVNALALSSPYAYLADGSGGLRVVNITDPTNLQEVSSFASPAPLLDVAVSDGFAYLAGDAFWIADLSDPISPTIVFTYTIPSYYYKSSMRHVVAYQERVYATWELDDCGCGGHSCWLDAGLIVFERDASSGWRIVSEQSLRCPIGDLEIIGNEGFIISLPIPLAWSSSNPWYYPMSELLVFDASNPPFTEILQTSPIRGSPSDLSVLDGSVIIANQERGLEWLEWWSNKYFLPFMLR